MNSRRGPWNVTTTATAAAIASVGTTIQPRDRHAASRDAARAARGALDAGGEAIEGDLLLEPPLLVVERAEARLALRAGRSRAPR